MERILLRSKKHPEQTKLAKPRDAKLLLRLGWELASDAPPPEPVEEAPKPRRQYKRRDMEAEK